MDHVIFAREQSLRKVAKSLPPNERSSFKHSNQVKRTALLVGEALGLSPYELSLLKIAAFWHDIGKFDRELRSLFFDHKGKFTEEETKKASLHAYVSAVLFQARWEQFVSLEAMVKPIAIIIVGHHWTFCESEHRYRHLISTPDFQYPDKEHDSVSCMEERERADFPLLGMRILKVVDHFQGETEKRHYKQGRDPHDTMQEMVLNADKEYDPSVLAAFCEVLYRKLRAKPNVLKAIAAI